MDLAGAPGRPARPRPPRDWAHYLDWAVDSFRLAAAGVGEATTSSVVTSITSVIAADTVFNILLVRLYD